MRFDGRSAPAAVHPNEERALYLYEAGKSWRRAEVPVEVSTKREALEEYERAYGRAALVVVAHCRPTNARQTFRPHRSYVDSGRWEGMLELERDNFRDRVELRAMLTCAAGGVPHRPVAFADPWVLHFDEPASLRLHGTLNVRWVNFKTFEDSLVRQFQDSTHVVSFRERMPEVWLNAAFEGLEPLLRDRKDRRGADKALHDMQRMSIARSVWMALVTDAMSAVRPVEDGDEPEWPESDWQAEVLRRVLAEVDPGKSERELLQLAAEEWRTHPGSEEFLSRAEAVIGDLIKANETLRRFVQHYREGVEQ